MVCMPLQAIEASSFELRNIPAICSELTQHWKAILDYLTSRAPSHAMQGVKGKVSISQLHFCRSLLVCNRPAKYIDPSCLHFDSIEWYVFASAPELGMDHTL